MVSAEAKDRETAVALLKLLTSEPYQKRIAEEGGDVPVVELKPDPERMPSVAKELQEEMTGMKRTFIFCDVGLGMVIGNEYNTAIQAILAGK